jgi:hypothetical protein
MMNCKIYIVLQTLTNCMLIMNCFGWFEYFWVFWNYDDVLKYEYDMWSHCMLWLGVLKTGLQWNMNMILEWVKWCRTTRGGGRLEALEQLEEAPQSINCIILDNVRKGDSGAPRQADNVVSVKSQDTALWTQTKDFCWQIRRRPGFLERNSHADFLGFPRRFQCWNHGRVVDFHILFW